MTTNSFLSARRFGRHLFALLIVAMVTHALPGHAAQDDSAEQIKACFEGPASKAAGSSGEDDFSRRMREAAAGKQCDEIATNLIHACLGKVDAAGEDDVKDYYPCIGIVANPCIDSEWASSDFRSVICIGTEEAVWLDILHEKLDALRAVLGEEPKQQLEVMQEAFFKYRNEKCGLIRALQEGSEPDIAYGACTTETAARFAIDLREMALMAAPDDAEAQQDEEPPADQPETISEEDALGSKVHPVRADNPGGEQAYLERLRCPDGTAPSFSRQGSMGYGGYGNIVDLYAVRCGETGESYKIYMDMYHPGYVETYPVPGFTLVEE